MISVRHTKNIAENLRKAQAEELKHIVDKVFSEADVIFRRMATLKLGSEDTARILELLFPPTKAQREANKEPERWDRITDILENPNVTPRCKP